MELPWEPPPTRSSMIWILIKPTFFTQGEWAQQVQPSSPLSEPMPLTQCTTAASNFAAVPTNLEPITATTVSSTGTVRWPARATSNAAPRVPPSWPARTNFIPAHPGLHCFNSQYGSKTGHLVPNKLLHFHSLHETHPMTVLAVCKAWMQDSVYDSQLVDCYSGAHC